MTVNLDLRDVKSVPVGVVVPNDMAQRPSRSNRLAQSVVGRQGRGLYSILGKRVLDIGLIMLALPVVLPVLLVLAAVIALFGGSPIYVQKRVGLGGRTFRMFKLRTMVRDADDRLAEYLAANPTARAEWNLRQKLTHDPRITAFGAILRRSSLDELPQLWNVLRGDMSLVGPRPMMETQRNQYPGTAYYRLRPGLTGPWQVGARHLTTFADRSIFDDQYENRHGLVYDLSILLRTVRVVASGTGC
jgi:exopolysaccharide production protein ExoY